jgi:membrane-associated phospholipid phosphatase
MSATSPTTEKTPALNDERTLAGGIRQAIVLAVIMMSSLGGYLAVLYWRGYAGKDRVTHTPWDDFFPFEPAWVWVYLIPYLIGPIVIGALRPSTFRWYVERGLVTVVLSLAIFAAWPTQTKPREYEVTGTDWTSLLYQKMIAIDDPPANAAPSLHVSLTCLLAFALLRDFPRWWPVTAVGVILVWLATLFTRQHHLIDVATGALLACAVVLVWPARRAGGVPSVGLGGDSK